MHRPGIETGLHDSHPDLRIQKLDPPSSPMTKDNEIAEPATEEPPTFLSSLPAQPITDDIVRQIGESDHPKIRGAIGLPGSEPGKIEVFQLDLETKTYVLVFDPTAEQWRVYDSFETEGMSHEEIIDRAADVANAWLAESLSDRIAAAEETGSDTEPSS